MERAQSGTVPFQAMTQKIAKVLLAAAGIGLLFFLAGGPYPKTTTAFAGESNHWVRLEGNSPTNGSQIVAFSLQSDTTIRNWAGQLTRPTFVVLCGPGGMQAFLDTGLSAAVENAFGTHRVSLKFDTETAKTQFWLASANQKALFAPNARALARRIAASKIVRFRFSPLDRQNDITLTFAVSGLEYRLQSEKLCAWNIKRQPLAAKDSSQIGIETRAVITQPLHNQQLGVKFDRLESSNENPYR
jgi:hypothetical protein